MWYGMVWYSMIWHGMVWYDMVWYGIIRKVLTAHAINSSAGQDIVETWRQGNLWFVAVHFVELSKGRIQ